jgi:hypothetical protein
MGYTLKEGLVICLKTFRVRAGLAALVASGILSGPACRVHVHEEAPPPRREVVVVEEPRHEVLVVERRQPTTEVIITTAPPPPRREVIVGVAPSPNHVWVGGYWAWNGRAHVWMPGCWVARPHANATWVAGRWETRGGGHVWIAGGWRLVSTTFGTAGPADPAGPAFFVSAEIRPPRPAVRSV